VPLGWAGVFTIMFLPVHQRVRRYIQGRNRAALVSTFLLTLLIIVPGIFVLTAFTAQVIDTAQWAQGQWQEGGTPLRDFLERTVPLQRILDWLAERNVSEEEVNALVSQKLQQVAGFVAGQAGRLARNVVFLLFDLFVVLFATFYLFRDGGYLCSLSPRTCSTPASSAGWWWRRCRAPSAGFSSGCWGLALRCCGAL
jgi:predicted PurR-regulated permease PerM